jgi:hypothetical protein
MTSIFFRFTINFNGLYTYTGLCKILAQTHGGTAHPWLSPWLKACPNNFFWISTYELMNYWAQPIFGVHISKTTRLSQQLFGDFNLWTFEVIKFQHPFMFYYNWFMCVTMVQKNDHTKLSWLELEFYLCTRNSFTGYERTEEVKGICCVLLSMWIEFSSSRVMVDELTHPHTLTCLLRFGM